jgi:hypothetical protein
MKKINNFFNRFFKNKRSILFLVLFLAIGIFLAGNWVYADVGDAVATLLSWIVQYIVQLVGGLITLILWVLVGVAQYNDFITAQPVVSGWAIVRDFCNMFFILLLLVVAFATILRVEGYDIKKMVPKLLVMAVLINFSKTICGLILDGANLVMNTFVSSFKDQLSQGFTQLLGINQILQVKTTSDSATLSGAAFGSAQTLIALFLAVVVSLIALVVIIVITAVLVIRMVMIWIYIVLSPMAYFLSTIPGGKKYASQWWGDFTNYVIVGPILAFFIWLSLTSMNVSSNIVTLASSQGAAPDSIKSAFTTGDVIIRFIIGIGMLLEGLIISQKIAGVAGGVIKTGMDKIQQGANFVKKNTIDRAASGAKNIGLTSAKMLDRLPATIVGDNKLGRGIAQHGVVGGLANVAKNIPGRAKDFIGNKIDQNYDINKALASGRGKEIVPVGNFEYKLNSEEKYQRYDKNATGPDKFVGGEGNDQYALKKKDWFGNEKAVGKMGGREAMFHSAVWSSGSVARAARFDAEENKTDEEKKKIVRFDDDQLHAIVGSMAASKTRRRAASEQLAERGKFNDYGEVQKAREIYGTNSVALGEFNNKVNVKQADKAYDFDNKYGNRDKDVQRFHGDIAKGNVDPLKLNLEKLSGNKDMYKAVEGFYGEDTADQIKKIASRALSKKDKDDAKKLMVMASQFHRDEATNAYQRADIAKGKSDFTTEATERKSGDDNLKKARKLQSEHGKFSGELGESFKHTDSKGASVFDLNSIESAFASFKPKDYDNIDADSIDKLVAAYSGGNKKMAQNIEAAIAKNIPTSALKKLASNGEREDVVKKLGDILMRNGKTNILQADKNLSEIMGLKYSSKNDNNNSSDGDKNNSGPNPKIQVFSKYSPIK